MGNYLKRSNFKVEISFKNFPNLNFFFTRPFLKSETKITKILQHFYKIFTIFFLFFQLILKSETKITKILQNFYKIFTIFFLFFQLILVTS